MRIRSNASGHFATVFQLHNSFNSLSELARTFPLITSTAVWRNYFLTKRLVYFCWLNVAAYAVAVILKRNVKLIELANFYGVFAYELGR